ncbi:MAG: GAF domain-containing protein, partial [Gemmatimonadetes bacterium]|nr:GAF domain-containing protein [Gemmatimonadota bacterium]
AALGEPAGTQRPWQQALITERAGLFHLACGMQHTAAMLLAQARSRYADWGAGAKVRQLEQAYGSLPTFDDKPLAPEPVRTGGITSDGLDMLAILRASQALSSETSLGRLKAGVVDLLATLTGATMVRFALWDEQAKDWFVSSTEQADGAPVGVEQAGALGLLPLSALRYAERTREPLLVEDATRDDRFAHDRSMSCLAQCSLLVVPILSQGVMRALLLLENRLSRGAFSAARLDAVMLIAGQLAVSLDNALLYEELEHRVQERTRELRETQAELVGTARRAGMAEIATNVLHNVGNILNSVNVSANLIASRLHGSKAQGLARAVQLLEEHAGDLSGFLATDPRGKLLPQYLSRLSQALAAEQQELVQELARLTTSVDHIKGVVATQQSYAGGSTLLEPVQLSELVDDALRINGDSLAGHQVMVVKDFADVPPVPLDKTRVMEILVNLISNAKHAMENVTGRPHRMTLRLGLCGTSVHLSVQDEGEGIAPENLTRIFAHGFTTRKAGHGFGLHSCALAARQMGGTLTAHSEGPGLGATFTLELRVAADKSSVAAASAVSSAT